MKDKTLNPAMHGALFWYSLGAYRRLEGLPADEETALRDALLDFTTEVAPYRGANGRFPTREIPVWGQVSIIHAIAIAGAILVKHQVGVDGEERLRDMSPILASCVDAWELYQKEVEHEGTN